jgi:hypothetical protein
MSRIVIDGRHDIGNLCATCAIGTFGTIGDVNA